MFLLVNETAARKCWPGGNPIATRVLEKAGSGVNE
jgi:hypothetical protein